MSLTRDDYAAIIRDGAQSVGTESALNLLVLHVPIFANPVLNKIARLVISKILEKLIQQTEFGMFYAYVDIRTSAQGRAFIEAVQARKALGKDATPEEKEKAEHDQIRRFAELASWNS